MLSVFLSDKNALDIPNFLLLPHTAQKAESHTHCPQDLSDPSFGSPALKFHNSAQGAPAVYGCFHTDFCSPVSAFQPMPPPQRKALNSPFAARAKSHPRAPSRAYQAGLPLPVHIRADNLSCSQKSRQEILTSAHPADSVPSHILTLPALLPQAYPLIAAGSDRVPGAA